MVLTSEEQMMYEVSDKHTRNLLTESRFKLSL